MGAIRTLPADVDLEFLHEGGGDSAEDVRAVVIAFAQEALVVFHGAWAEVLVVAGQVQGELDAGVGAIGFGGLVGGPLFEFHDNEEADHGVNSLGRASKSGAEVFRDLRGRQTFKGGAAEDAVPAFIEGAQGCGIKLGVDPVSLEVVEEEVLWQVSGGDEVAHEMI